MRKFLIEQTGNYRELFIIEEEDDEVTKTDIIKKQIAKTWDNKVPGRHVKFKAWLLPDTEAYVVQSTIDLQVKH